MCLLLGSYNTVVLLPGSAGSLRLYNYVYGQAILCGDECNGCLCYNHMTRTCGKESKLLKDRECVVGPVTEPAEARKVSMKIQYACYRTEEKAAKNKAALLFF